MNSKNGIVSVYTFLLGLSVIPVLFSMQNSPLLAFKHGDIVNVSQLFVVYATITNVLVRIVSRGVVYKVRVMLSRPLAAVWCIQPINVNQPTFFCVTDMRPGLVFGIGHGWWSAYLSTGSSLVETFWMVSIYYQTSSFQLIDSVR